MPKLEKRPVHVRSYIRHLPSGGTTRVKSYTRHQKVRVGTRGKPSGGLSEPRDAREEGWFTRKPLRSVGYDVDDPTSKRRKALKKMIDELQEEKGMSKGEAIKRVQQKLDGLLDTRKDCLQGNLISLQGDLNWVENYSLGWWKIPWDETELEKKDALKVATSVAMGNYTGALIGLFFRSGLFKNEKLRDVAEKIVNNTTRFRNRGRICREISEMLLKHSSNQSEVKTVARVATEILLTLGWPSYDVS